MILACSFIRFIANRPLNVASLSSNPGICMPLQFLKLASWAYLLFYQAKPVVAVLMSKVLHCYRN